MSVVMHQAGNVQVSEPRRRCIATLASWSVALATLALSGTAPMAGCNSGSTNNTNALHTSACQASATGNAATAVGLALASGNMATAVGDTARATSIHATAFGYRSDAPADGSTSVGTFARGVHIWSTAIGAGTDSSRSPRAQGSYSIAIGGGNEFYGGNRGALAENSYGIAIGTGAHARGDRSVAVGDFTGHDATAGNASNSAFGSRAGRSVTGNGNTAVGQQTGGSVVGSGNTAIGSAAGFTVNGNNNIAGGTFAGWTVNGRNNAAYGVNAGGSVTGDANVAIGAGVGRNFTASNTIAVGAEASATRNGAIALGYGASATKPQAVAIGQGSVANAANTVSVGSAGNARRIVNVADGINPTDAVNLGQLQAFLSGQAPAAGATGTVSHGQFEALLPAASASAAPRPAVVDSNSRLIDIERKLADLQTLVQRQQERIAELENRRATATRAE